LHTISYGSLRSAYSTQKTPSPRYLYRLLFIPEGHSVSAELRLTPSPRYLYRLLFIPEGHSVSAELRLLQQTKTCIQFHMLLFAPRIRHIRPPPLGIFTGCYSYRRVTPYPPSFGFCSRLGWSAPLRSQTSSCPQRTGKGMPPRAPSWLRRPALRVGSTCQRCLSRPLSMYVYIQIDRYRYTGAPPREWSWLRLLALHVGSTCQRCRPIRYLYICIYTHIYMYVYVCVYIYI